MKRNLLWACLILLFATRASGQISPDFTAADCAGNSHNLYSELDSGKVIVLSLVMPCSLCVFPALDAYSIVQGYQVSHPNTVRFYLCDDIANTTCTSLEDWADSIGIVQSSSSLRFSDTAINMLNYGIPGMPKTVVIGGAAHTIFYNENNAVNATDLQNAIDSALLLTGVHEQNYAVHFLNITPNPSFGTTDIGFVLEKVSDVSIELFSFHGAKLEVVFSGKLPTGENHVKLNTQTHAPGMYFLKITEGRTSKFVSLHIAH